MGPLELLIIARYAHCSLAAVDSSRIAMPCNASGHVGRAIRDYSQEYLQDPLVQ